MYYASALCLHIESTDSMMNKYSAMDIPYISLIVKSLKSNTIMSNHGITRLPPVQLRSRTREVCLGGDSL